MIAAKLRNLFALDYPAGKLTCILALDACTDATESIARRQIGQAGNTTVQLVVYPENRGKIAVLNDQIAQSKTDIVAPTDASALVPSDVLLKAAAHFQDPGVGVVTGSYVVSALDSPGETEYWRYQSELRAAESRLGGPMGAHGAFYLFRRSAWTPLPPDTINDDFVLPMTIVMNGSRAVFEPGVIAREIETTGRNQDFRRRVRLGAGNLQQVLRLWRLADPRRGWVAFKFVSGKGLRGVMPLLLLIVLITNLPLAATGSHFFRGLFAVEAMLCAVAMVGHRIGYLQTMHLGRAVTYFLRGCLAMTIGALMVVVGREGRAWSYSKGVRQEKAR